MFYDLDWNMNSYSNEFKIHMEDVVLIIIILQKSDKGFVYLYKILYKWT